MGLKEILWQTFLKEQFKNEHPFPLGIGAVHLKKFILGVLQGNFTPNIGGDPYDRNVLHVVYVTAEEDGDWLKGYLEILNIHILKRLKEEDQTKGKYGDFTVSISSQIQPQPDPDKWEEIYQWAVDNGRTDMLMKRGNAAPFREALESEDIENPPSDLIGTYTKETINLRQL